MMSVMNNIDCEFDRNNMDDEMDAAKPRVSDDNNEEDNLVNSGGVGNEEEARVSLMEVDSESSERSDDNKVRVSTESAGNDTSRIDGHGGERYNALLSEFDDFVANENVNVGTRRASGYGLEVGDMVWGKVKSHPWWPGHIFNEAFATASVRRTRREGHVLVAFFGDSSYGWFDPAELIPFDTHFVEKSQQTSSRTFVKAVEEAMDEAKRRCGLGVTCKCRNPYNFRPMAVQGYYAVDVPEFEPGGVYSAKQINNARERFQPSEILSFVKQLALAPQVSERKSIYFTKNKATVSAFRKALFEEFDETYAQAFGMHPPRPSQDRADLLAQSLKQPTRAPLSGPMVMAEALSGGKSSKKQMKVKDHSKKDRYLFKRRDEPGDSRMPTSQGQPGSSVAVTVLEGSSTLASGDYVLQKRATAPQTTVKFEQTVSTSRNGAGLSGGISAKEAATIDQTPAYSGTPAMQNPTVDAKLSPDMDEMKESVEPDVALGSTSRGQSDMLGKGEIPGLVDGMSLSSQQEASVLVDVKIEESEKMSRSYEVLQQSEPSFSSREEGGRRLGQVQDSHTGSHPSPIDAKPSVGMSPGGKMKKKSKVLKRPVGDLSSENSMIREQKKKKKKKEFGLETGSDPQQKPLVSAKSEIKMKNLTQKAAQAGLVSKEESRVNQQKKDVGADTSVLNSFGTSPGVSMGNLEHGLPQLLDDLHALALDPFHGAERNCPATILQCFQRFRSLVYQKSLVLSPPSENEPIEVRASKYSSTVGAPGENVRDLAASKPKKALARPEDPTKAGRKRLPSDRQEEIAAKRLKKINHLKSLTTEKKAIQRTSDGQRVEGKEQHASVPSLKPLRPNSVKKLAAPARTVEPTMLVMKFPPGTSLPSVAELKAKFGRFGSIDHSAIRVFWKSSTCRVVYRYKADAQAAYQYANGNNNPFGNLRVKYFIREVDAPATNEVPESDKGRGDEPSYETPRIKDPILPTPTLTPFQQQQQTIQLKSCLKKPDEAGQATAGNGGGSGGGRGTARVKFVLNGEETSGNRNNNNNNNATTTFGDGGAAAAPSSSSVAMDFNSKNFQKIIPAFSSSLPPLLPNPQFANHQLYNNHHSEAPPPPVAPRNSHNNLNTAPPPPPQQPQNIDISQQMISLLTRCNDVVTSLSGLLGYVPYHPL